VAVKPVQGVNVVETPFSTGPSASAPRGATSGGGNDATGGERGWPAGAAAQAVALQRLLAIGDRDWHDLKRQRPRRAAEQLAAALVQLLEADDPRQSQAGMARVQAIALVEHALGWLRAELSDPGCPQHGQRRGEPKQG
jgi:hypothetical protein